MTGNTSISEKQKRRRQLMLALTTLFPQCFASEASKKKPLKIGIRDDISEKFPGISKREISRILHHYTQKSLYLRKIKANADRFDLDGNVCGKITKNEAAIAKNRVRELAIKSQEKSKKNAEKKKMNQQKG